MEQKLKKLFNSYVSSTTGSMKQKEFENFIKVNKIYDEQEAGEIYKNYSKDDSLSFDSFMLALKQIAIQEVTGIEGIVNKIADIEKEELKEFEKKKKEIINRQKNREKNINMIPEEKVKEVIKDMNELGKIMKKEIINLKKNHPEKLIEIKEALKDKNKGTNFCLGVLAQCFEDNGIVTAIEKEADNSEESIKESETIMELMTNGMLNKKKLSLSYNFDSKRITELMNNKFEQEKFNNDFKKEAAERFKTSEDNIIVTNTLIGNDYNVQIIFMSDEFNDLEISEFKERFKNSDKLKYLKEIHKTLIMEACKLSPNMLDPEGNRISGWPDGEKRGGLPYYSPKGWMGFGLKVTGKYDNGNDDWLECNGNKNEWAVAYHGVGSSMAASLEEAVGNICKGGYKIGKSQEYKDKENANKPGTKVGIGIYCSPRPLDLEQYADYYKSSTAIKGEHYIMGLMMRVKPDKIRYYKNIPNYWVLNPTTDEMRPYRILVKEKK